MNYEQRYEDRELALGGETPMAAAINGLRSLLSDYDEIGTWKSAQAAGDWASEAGEAIRDFLDAFDGALG